MSARDNCFDSDCTDDDDDELSQDHIQTKGLFHGVYLLVSTNPKFKGKTYVGYTVNPNRRIKQHNGGKNRGGARQTSGRGPWDMILIIHGFPNDITALRFEWAWQHPSKSRRLSNSVGRHLSKETGLQYKLRILSHMLSIGPWHRLPLIIRWLKQEYEEPFPSHRQPPFHMPIAHGLIDLTANKQAVHTDEVKEIVSCWEKVDSNLNGSILCHLCEEKKLEHIEPSFITCYHKQCLFLAHITCLALKWCPDKEIIPISGSCPLCQKDLLWGELIKYSR